MADIRVPSSVKASLALPGFSIEGTWQPDDSECNAAWEMYVELVTRITVAELRTEEGLLREALSSLYSLFETTRAILRKYGPTVAKPKGDGTLSFGYLAVAILNRVLRPVLAKWHPLLRDHEERKLAIHSSLEHERLWERHDELRQVLREVQVPLTEYANLLAEVVGVPPLPTERAD